jgi:FAD/FMN-containing dehydrogenase
MVWSNRGLSPICSFSGKSAVDGGLMIDLGFIHQVDVDLKKRIARTGGGARLGHVDLATLKHNLVTVVGTDSDTGAGGLTLGGAAALNHIQWGFITT